MFFLHITSHGGMSSTCLSCWSHFEQCGEVIGKLDWRLWVCDCTGFMLIYVLGEALNSVAVEDHHSPHRCRNSSKECYVGLFGWWQANAAMDFSPSFYIWILVMVFVVRYGGQARWKMVRKKDPTPRRWVNTHHLPGTWHDEVDMADCGTISTLCVIIYQFNVLW